MAESPSHRFGQVIGSLLEEILLPVLLKFCEERGLYLDRHGERMGVRQGKKVTWTDKYENAHDLDFVVEKGGSATTRGRPVAFIEAAWRRYTKHSRNKAQEIQGAILPIAEKYERDSPFLGAVLAGVFTEGSLNQLRSLGFNIVHLPYDTLVHAFRSVGINAQFDEKTPDRTFAACIKQIKRMPVAKRNSLKATLLSANSKTFDQFFNNLRLKLDRVIQRVLVIPLFGDALSFSEPRDAERFIEGFDTASSAGQFQKFEITVVFSNRDEIRGMFAEKGRAQEFLRYVSS